MKGTCRLLMALALIAAASAAPARADEPIDTPHLAQPDAAPNEGASLDT